MNLWIFVLAIAWISVSVVIADHGWFVQDNPFGREKDGDLFSNEHLLIVKPNTNSPVKVKENKPKTVPPTPVHTPKAAPTVAKTAEDDLESDEFIPIGGPARKPLSIKEDSKLKVKPVEKRTSEKTIKSPQKSSNAWFVQEVSEQDEEDDLSREQLIVLKPKTKPKSATHLKTSKPTKSEKPKSQTTTTTTPKPVTKSPVKSKTNSQDVDSHHIQATGRKPLAAIKTGRKPLAAIKKEPSNPSPKVSPSKTDQDEETLCEDERDIDCLMETEELILVSKNKPKPKPKIESKPIIKKAPVKQAEVQKQEPPKQKETEVERAVIHRRLLDNENVGKQLPKKVDLQPLIYEMKEEEKEVVEEEEDDLLETEQSDNELLKRFRRQAGGDEVGSGGGDFVESRIMAEEPEFSVGMETRLNETYQTPLSEAEKQNISETFRQQLIANYGNDSQFVDVEIKNVSLDSDGRVVVDYNIVLKLSGATGDDLGTRSQNALDYLTDTVVPGINNMTVNGNPVYQPLDPAVIKAAAEAIFTDLCNSVNACPDGYVCRNEGLIASCMHLCYDTNLINECQNGGSCQLNDTFQPYCQCGSGFTGERCENATADGAQDTYTTPELVGAGAAGAVAALGAAGCCFYLALFRKKKEEDMEYSYFGDEDTPPPTYSDVSDQLGNFYAIDRPHISITPRDIYGDGGYNA